MDETIPTRSNTTGKRVLRWVLGIAAVACISLLYPNNLTFPYQFERGQTWRYADLRAPYDVQVRKTPVELEEDRQMVVEGLTPVYLADETVSRNARAGFLADFRELIDTSGGQVLFDRDLLRQSEQYRRWGLLVLDRLYSRGVIQTREEDLMDGLSKVVTIVNGNQVQERTIGQTYTPATARQWLTDSLFYTNLRAPEALLPLLNQRLTYNLFYSDSLTNRFRERELSTISPYKDLVREGEIIVEQGQTITDNVYQELISYRQLYNENLSAQSGYYSVFAGYSALVGLVIMLLFLYLRSFYPEIFSRLSNLTFILVWPLLYALLVRTAEYTPGLSAYVVPFCIVPIVMKIFFTERLAFFVHVAVVLITSFLTSLGYPFTFLSIMAGVVVIFMDIDARDWSRYFRSLMLLLVYYVVGYVGLELLRGATVWTADYTTLAWLAGNVFLVLLAYPLIPLLERIFGFLSPVTLTELTDMNRPLLQKLARQAAGTWQHSLNVGNMAEQAAREIGADALLVKTAALYHDIGKTENPEYFIENQNGPNPHDQLDELESAKIIIGHVTHGITLAQKAGLPKVLIDFIRTHHGTTRAEYFYRTYIKDHPERERFEPAFRYPGPRPTTKEQTILMLADSIEAACKSLRNPTEKELFDLIDNVIRGKLTSGQLEDSKLNFAELEACRRVFRSIMKSVHHLRIAYPDKDKEATELDQGPARAPGKRLEYPEKES